MERNIEVKGKAFPVVTTDEVGDVVGMGLAVEIEDIVEVTRPEGNGSKSFGMPGEKRWNSGWEPTGPTPPWSKIIQN